MFSSLNTSLSNLYQNATFSVHHLSPQAILASYLSASLAEFLQVDSHFIETSLFTNQHVTLHQIRLKPRTVRNNNTSSETITLTGTIQEIEFRWEWDTQTYISNVRLRIVGVDLRLSKDDDNNNRSDVPEQIRTEEDLAIPTTTPPQTNNGDWKAVYMQQIVDHLSVSIEAIQITICLDDKTLIVLGSGIDLTTNEQQQQENLDDSSSLLQQISMRSLSAYFKQPNGELMQLLADFGYSATVHRVAGRRFVDGIRNGLVITGNPRESIQWYLGAVQIDGLLQLLQLVRVVEPEMDMRLPEPTSSDCSTSSIFQLPLPSMTVLLEENIKLQFKDGVVQYRTDGSKCILQFGSVFAEMIDEQLVVLNNLTIDAINCSVLLSKPEDDNDTINVKLPLCSEMVERYRNISCTYGKVMHRTSDSVKAAESDNDCNASKKLHWSLNIQGNSKFKVTNELGWMQCSMENLTIFTKYATKIPFDASWENAHLSSSHGVIGDVSMMELVNDTFHLSGSVNVTITSKDAATQFLEFLNDAASNYTVDESSQSMELPCNVILPKINAVILEPDRGIHFECENVEVEGASLSLRGQSVKISTAPNEISTNYFSCRGFHTAFELLGTGADQNVKIKITNMCSIQYLSYVCVQALNAEATISPNNLNSISDVMIDAAEAVLSADFRSESWSKQIESESEADPISLPNIVVSKMNLTLHFIGGGITLENAKIGLPEFKGNASTRSDTLTMHYLKLVKKRLPFLLTKANVAGVNVGDSLSSAVATMAVNSSLVGTLVGVVGKDGVGAAITAGKATRGASESERYHFGDFSKGLAASTRSASFSGATAASSTYASENRVRLSSAAGSGVGMVAGMALAGPVGLVAGSILAGRAVGNAVERRFGDPKTMTTSTTEQLSVSDEEMPTTESSADAILPENSTQPSSKEVDLLGSVERNLSVTLTQVDLSAENTNSDSFGNLQLTPANGEQKRHTVDTTRAFTDVAASPASESRPGGGYKFGSITRGVIARGKAARGAKKAEGYKFGDFTRGFLK